MKNIQNIIKYKPLTWTQGKEIYSSRHRYQFCLCPEHVEALHIPLVGHTYLCNFHHHFEFICCINGFSISLHSLLILVASSVDQVSFHVQCYSKESWQLFFKALERFASLLGRVETTTLALNSLGETCLYQFAAICCRTNF